MGQYIDDSGPPRKMSKCKEVKKLVPAAVAWILLLSTTGLFFTFTARWFGEKYTIWIPVAEALLALIVIANFTLATFMDPGIIPKATRGEDDNDDLRAPLYKTVEVQGTTVRMKWCVTCQFYRPPRCSHCSVCNNCIETFDHHCPWVNNCIGRRNYRFFFMFLLSLSLHMMAIFSLCLIHLLQEMERNMSALPVIISISIIVVICILFIPIFGLTCFHIILVSRGRTTNEQVTGKYRGGFNPFSRGCCFNCWFTLCGPQYPGLVEAKKKAAKNAHTVTYHPTGGGGGGGGNNGGGNQVKVYVDNGRYSKRTGNLPSLHSPRNYSQMMPASNRELSDTDMGVGASQSLDCEPTPPIQRHGSKSNFFLPTGAHPDSDSSMSHLRHMRGPHGSPHPNRQRRRPPNLRSSGSLQSETNPTNDLSHSLKGEGVVRSRSQTPDSLSSPSDHGVLESPTLHQKIRAIGGVPTPFTASASPLTRRSNPPTPTSTHGHRPEFMGLSQPSITSHGGPQSAYYEQHYAPNGSGDQRRFLSEGELLYDYHGGGVGGGLGSRDVSGVIRELASSPQRGVYNWKDCSPTSTSVAMNNFPPQPHVHPSSSSSVYYHSNPTSPLQQQQQLQQGQMQSSQPNMLNNRVCYHHIGGSSPMGGYSPSPPAYHHGQSGGVVSGDKKMYPSGGPNGSEIRPSPNSRRPMSFVRALEMTDSMELNNRVANSPAGPNKLPSQVPPLNDRASVYDINYEISV